MSLICRRNFKAYRRKSGDYYKGTQHETGYERTPDSMCSKKAKGIRIRLKGLVLSEQDTGKSSKSKCIY